MSGSTTLAFQSSSQCVCVAGQRLKFAACHAPLEPDETRWVQSSGSNGMSVVATCARAKLFAYTEKSLESKINVQLPRLHARDHARVVLAPGLHCLAFSRDGAKLAALTDLPEPTLVVFDLKYGTVLASGPLLVPCTSVSFNPSGDGSIVTMSPKRLLLWKLKLVYKTYLLESKEIPMDEATDDEAEAASATWTSHCWSPGNLLFATSDVGGIVRLAVGGGGAPALALRCSSGVAAVVADTTHLVVGCADGSLRWFGLPGEEELDEETSLLWTLSLESPIQALVYSPDYLQILATTESGETHLVKYLKEQLPLEPLAAGRIVESEKVSSYHSGAVLAAKTLPVVDLDSGNVGSYDVVSCSSDGTLRCIDALTRMEVARVTTSSSAAPSAIATCGANMLVALGTADGVLRLYTRRLDQMPLLLLVWRGRLSTSAVQRLAFSPDGAHLAASCADGTVITLHLPKGCDSPTLLPHYVTSEPATSIVLTSGGKLLMGFANGKVLLAPIPTGSPGEEASMGACPSIVLQSGVVDLLEAPSTYEGAHAGGAVTILAACTDYGVHVYDIPPSGATGNKVSPKETPMNFQSTGKVASGLCLSLDGSMLESAGAMVRYLSPPSTISATAQRSRSTTRWVVAPRQSASFPIAPPAPSTARASRTRAALRAACSSPPSPPAVTARRPFPRSCRYLRR